MLFGAAVEIAALAAVVPFLSALTGPNSTPCAFKGLVPCELGFETASIVFVGVVFASAIIRTLLLWVSTRFSYALGADVGNEVFRRVLYQPYEFHTTTNSSEIIAGIIKVNLLIQQVLTPSMQAIVSFVLSAAIFSALLSLHALAALASAVMFVSLYSIAVIGTRRIVTTNGKIVAELESSRMKSIQEGLGGIRDIILEDSQPLHADHFSAINTAQRRAQATNTFLRGAPRFAIEAIGMSFIVGLAYAVNESGGDKNVVPLLGALALGAQKLLPQVQQIYTAFSSLQGSHAILADVLALLKRPMPVQSRESGGELPLEPKQDSVPLVCLRGVSFRYVNSDSYVLNRVDLDIKRAQCVGLIGKTGSGKSTLVDIILGLLDPTSGAIEIAGHTRDSGKLGGWQQRVAHVPQTIFLADASVLENIAIGSPRDSIDRDKILKAVRSACLQDVLDRLPEGLETKIGERGVRLSGGQRQRIGIARALYKGAELLVLDEATSALDEATERAVIDGILDQESAPTIVMIAHRVHTLERCDVIYRVEDGEVRKVGDYAALAGFNK